MNSVEYVDSNQIKYLHDLGGPPLVLKMIALFFENAPLRLEEMKKGEREKNYDDIFQAVHKLKSSAGNFGATRLFDLCGKIEGLIRANKPEETPPLLRELEVISQHVLASLQTERERLNT